MSERAFQLEGTGQWVKGKSADTFGRSARGWSRPTKSRAGTSLDMWLEVDGHRYQNGNTRTMVFGVPFLVSYLSRFMSLHPGDVITTGTPPGVGLGQKPPVYLRPGTSCASVWLAWVNSGSGSSVIESRDPPNTNPHRARRPSSDAASVLHARKISFLQL